MTIILKENSKAIRKKIQKAGIKVCVCASFRDSCWLDFHTRIRTNKVHGVGYFGEETETTSQEEECKRFMAECHDPYVCKSVDEFISLVKLALNVRSEIADNLLLTIKISKEGDLESNLRQYINELKDYTYES